MPSYFNNDLNIFYCEEKISLMEIINNVTDFMKNKNFDKPYQLKGDNYSVIIKSLNEKIENTNNIDFSRCEKIIRNKYPDQDFKIIQFNIENHNENIYTDQVEYEVYNNLGQKVDLSICENVKVNIEYKIKDNSLLDIDKKKENKKKRNRYF